MNINISKVRQSHTATAQLIVDNVCFESLAEYYSLSHDMDFSLLCAMIRDIAASEVNHYGGDSKNIENWLMGLPSLLTVPFTYHDIEKWLRANGVLNDDSKDGTIDKALTNYWNVVAFVISSYAYKNKEQLPVKGAYDVDL